MLIFLDVITAIAGARGHVPLQRSASIYPIAQ